jgi:hypothetical protein
MANSIVSGLFGADPAVLQAQQQQTDMQNALQFAQLNPLQRATMATYQGAAGLGRAAGGLLGIQDPMIQQATELKQIASQFDISTPEGLTQLAQAIQGKYPQQAQQAIAAAQKMKLDEATKDLIVDSAMASSSRVETPGLIAALTAARACAVINPASRMAIMSELDFSEIRSRAKIILRELGLGHEK